MIVLVTGSRNFDDQPHICRVLDFVWACAQSGNETLVVRHGLNGLVDLAAHKWAVRRHNDGERVIPDPHPAQWGVYGRRAGVIRNTAMVAAGGVDICLGFDRGNSTGTADCLAKARAAGIPTWFHPYGLAAEPPPQARLIRGELWTV